MSILAYILFFIPLLTGAHKTSEFAKYHANQGTVLFLFMVAWGIVYGILFAVLAIVLWRTFGVVAIILGLLWLIPVALCVLGIVNAVQGKMKPLPVIGKITIIR